MIDLDKMTPEQLELERLKAVTAIQNCMAHYETVHISTEFDSMSTECFAMWRPDVSCEVSDWGCVFGPDALQKFWDEQTAECVNGGIFFHTLCTPCIEVAGDCKTAKVIWASAGFETMPAGVMADEAKSFWCWGKYGMDFIRNPETGEWKIWHMKWFRQIRNDYYVDWYKDSKNTLKGFPGKQGGGFQHPDCRPSVFHRPYSAESAPHPFPWTPKPYEHYNGDFRWIYGGEELEKKFGVTYPAYEKYYNVNYPENI